MIKRLKTRTVMKEEGVRGSSLVRLKGKVRKLGKCFDKGVGTYNGDW